MAYSVIIPEKIQATDVVSLNEHYEETSGDIIRKKLPKIVADGGMKDYSDWKPNLDYENESPYIENSNRPWLKIKPSTIPKSIKFDPIPLHEFLNFEFELIDKETQITLVSTARQGVLGTERIRAQIAKSKTWRT